jgi:hypothetical protein
MKLMTKELEDRFTKVGSQEHIKDPVVIAHFFNPTGGGDWFATEYDHANKIFFGYVSIFRDWNDEWGSFSLEELESYKGKLGLGIERDRYFDEMPFSVIEKQLHKSQ